MTAIGSGVLAALLATAASPPICDGGRDASLVPVGLDQARIGVAPSPCSAARFGFGAAGRVVAQPRDFYGNITLAGLLVGGLPAFDNWEFFGALEVIRFQTVISALSASGLGLGDLSLGVAHDLGIVSEKMAARTFVQAGFPTSTSRYRNARPVALEAGTSLAVRLSDSMLFVSRGSLLLSGAFAPGFVDPRLGLNVGGGVVAEVASWAVLTADADARFFHEAALDFLALGAGAEFAIGRAALQLMLRFPLLGEERALIAGFIGLSWRP